MLEDRGWADAKVDGDTELRSRRYEQGAGAQPLMHTGGGSTTGDQASSVWMSFGLTGESLPGPATSSICVTLCQSLGPYWLLFPNLHIEGNNTNLQNSQTNKSIITEWNHWRANGAARVHVQCLFVFIKNKGDDSSRNFNVPGMKPHTKPKLEIGMDWKLV